MLIMAGLTCHLASAQEPQLARVLVVEPDAITLRLEPATDNPAQTLVVPFAANTLPHGIRVGGWVRLWLEPNHDGQNDALAGARLDVLNGAAPAQDRTGVRARLMQGTRRSAAGSGGRGGR